MVLPSQCLRPRWPFVSPKALVIVCHSKNQYRTDKTLVDVGVTTMSSQQCLHNNEGLCTKTLTTSSKVSIHPYRKRPSKRRDTNLQSSNLQAYAQRTNTTVHHDRHTLMLEQIKYPTLAGNLHVNLSRC